MLRTKKYYFESNDILQTFTIDIDILTNIGKRKIELSRLDLLALLMFLEDTDLICLQKR